MTRKFWYILSANIIFGVHLCAVFVICFGWVYPALLPFHYVLLFSGSLLQLVLGYCFLSRWEFELRKLADPTITYDGAYITHYMRVIFGEQITPQFMHVVVPVTFGFLTLIQGGVFYSTYFS